MSIHKKIIEIMKNVEYLKKDDSVGFGNAAYKAISEEKVTKAIREQLIKQGVTIYPMKQEHVMTDYDGGVSSKGNPVVNHLAIVNVTYRITDIDDDTFIEVASSGTGVDTQDKAVGKAMTYAYKYMLLRTFAIPTGEDPDKISSEEIDNSFNYENKANKGVGPKDAKEAGQHILTFGKNKGKTLKDVFKNDQTSWKWLVDNATGETKKCVELMVAAIQG